MSNLRSVSASGVALAALIVAGPAMAQATPGTTAPGATADAAGPVTAPASRPPETSTVAQAQTTTGDIVVTARRVAESLQNVPLSISAVGAVRLEATRTFTPESLDGAVAGVKVFKTVGQSNGYAIFIRGIGRDNNLFNVEAPVAFYVDDVYYPYQVGPVIDIGGIDRVEVLRGPQGTLYGRNATVGTVKYISTRPDLDEVKGRLNLTGGSFGRAEVNGGVSVPIIPGELGIKVDAGYRSYGGYMHDVFADKTVNGISTFSGKASLLWQPTDTFELFVSGDATRSRDEPNIATPFTLTNVTSGGTLVKTVSGVDQRTLAVRRSPSNYDGEHAGGDLNILDASGGTIQAKLDVGDATFKSITAYRGYGYAYITDITATRAAGAFQRLENHDRTFTQEFQVAGSLFDDRLTYIGGLFYLRSNSNATSLRESRPGGVLVQTTAFTRQISKSYSAYIDGTFKITPELSISGGVRYTKDEKDVDQSVSRTNGAPFAGSGSDSWKEVTPRVSVDYKIGNDVLVYASWGKGYKAGQLNSIEPSSLAALGVFVPPEKATGKEVGVKATLFDRLLTINADYFWTNYKDQTQAILVPGGTGGALVTQLVFADAKVSGFELESTLRPVQDWTISGTLTTLHGKNTNVQPGHPAFNNVDKTLKHAPDLTWRISSEYTLRNLVANGDLAFGADYSFIDDTWESIIKNDLTLQKAYHLLDVHATLSFADGKYQITAAGTNVTDVAYAKVVSNPLSRFYSAPAEYSVTLKYRF